MWRLMVTFTWENDSGLWSKNKWKNNPYFQWEFQQNLNCNKPNIGENESWKKLFWIQFSVESICMCWKHKTKTGQCHCLIIFANVRWKCAALSWASFVAILFLLCNRIFLMIPLHDLLLIIRWHLIRNDSALSMFILYLLSPISTLLSPNGSISSYQKLVKIPKLYEKMLAHLTKK